MVVSDACHRASLRYDVFETVEQFEDFLFGERIRIISFYSGKFTGKPVMHFFRIFLVDMAERILLRILVNPY